MRQWTILLAADFFALAGLIAVVVWRARPITEVVRWRNALLLKPSRAEDFSWVPPHFPTDFKVERRPAPQRFRDVVAAVGVDLHHTEWENALSLAAHLVERAEDKGPLQSDLVTTYCGIREGYGYCADFVRVFLGMAHACRLTARQWSFAFDGFGGHGHTFVEVFDRQRGKWLFIDVFNNFHAIDTATGEPLSALEYRDSLLGRRSAAVSRRNGPGWSGFVHEHKALEYYRRGIHQWYLWWGNAVFSYDANPLVRWAGRISWTLAQVVATAAGVLPRIRIYETTDNVREVRNMFALRRAVLVIAALATILSAMLIILLLWGPRT